MAVGRVEICCTVTKQKWVRIRNNTSGMNLNTCNCEENTGDKIVDKSYLVNIAIDIILSDMKTHIIRVVCLRTRITN